jgi:hypothetical protein
MPEALPQHRLEPGQACVRAGSAKPLGRCAGGFRASRRSAYLL